MNNDTSDKLWKNIPHQTIGAVDAAILNGPDMPMRLVRIKRALLAMGEDSENDPRAAIIDVISEAFHLARHLGFDSDNIMNNVLENMREETPIREKIGSYVLVFSGVGTRRSRMTSGGINHAIEEVHSRDEPLESAGFREDGCASDKLPVPILELTDDERVYLGITPEVFYRIPGHTAVAMNMTLQEA